MSIYQQGKAKKTVRIMTPSMSNLSTNNAVEGNDNDVLRKRQYRVGLNLFNLNPEHGVEYLTRKGFVSRNPSEVAKFLHGRKGLSKAKVKRDDRTT